MPHISLRLATATAFALGLLLAAQHAHAVALYIDRTQRTIDVPAECPRGNAAFNPAALPAFAAGTPGPANAGVPANTDGRITFVLAQTTRLVARAHNNAQEFSWYNFQPDDNRYDLANAGPVALTAAQQLARAYLYARCGLPALRGDRTLYQFPSGAGGNPTLGAFITWAMGPQPLAGPDPRLPSGYRLLGNGEREGIIMYAAERIKMDLTNTVVSRRNICTLYKSIDHRPSCWYEQAAADWRESMIGYLYEGMNRVSYTAHEFWMIFNIAEYKNKIYFTDGNVLANGNQVDRFFTYQTNTGNVAPWHDPNGNNAVLPIPAGQLNANLPAHTRIFRLHGIHRGQHQERDFFENELSQYFNTNDPHLVVFGQL